MWIKSELCGWGDGWGWLVWCRDENEKWNIRLHSSEKFSNVFLVVFFSFSCKCVYFKNPPKANTTKSEKKKGRNPKKQQQREKNSWMKSIRVAFVFIQSVILESSTKSECCAIAVQMCLASVLIQYLHFIFARIAFHYYYKSHVESCVDASALVTIVGVCDAAAALSFFVKHISLDGFYELLKEGPVFLYIRIIIRAN